VERIILLGHRMDTQTAGCWRSFARFREDTTTSADTQHLVHRGYVTILRDAPA